MKFQAFIYKLIMDTVGKDSEGIQLAEKHGLNSAEVMDYIYRNIPTPRGNNFFGKWADSLFLNFPTWKSIRKRKSNLESVLFSVIQSLRTYDESREIRILDLASGYGQYVFSTLNLLGNKLGNIYVEMRDNDINCAEKINQLNQGKFNVNFIKTDILIDNNFDYENKFDIVILSGFYDSKTIGVVQKSMNLVENLLKDNGYFIFTYQASHVDTELVNQLFHDTNNAQLKMDERDKSVMEYFAEKSAFKVLEERADEDRRYVVVTSAKVGQGAKIEHGSDAEVRIMPSDSSYEPQIIRFKR